MPQFPQPGGCLCGGVRYELTADPLTLYACHCTDCQTGTGGAFGLSMIVPAEALRLVAGEPERPEVHLPDGRAWRLIQCGTCLVELWGESLEEHPFRNLRPGTLDDTSWAVPVGHIWTRSAPPWTVIPDDTVNYEGQPEDFAPLVVAWKERDR